jgi:plasmid stabilization system protein ParE
MVSVFFLPAAAAELLAAQEWYDTRAGGLGDRFFAAVDSLLPRIGENPRQFPLAYDDLRRALVTRFPYALFFRTEAEGIYVVACAHTSRTPFYWQQVRQ